MGWSLIALRRDSCTVRELPWETKSSAAVLGKKIIIVISGKT